MEKENKTDEVNRIETKLKKLNVPRDVISEFQGYYDYMIKR